MSDSVNEILWDSMATSKNSEVTPHEALMSSDLGHTEADTSFWHLCFGCVRSDYSCHACGQYTFSSGVSKHLVNHLHHFLSHGFKILLDSLTRPEYYIPDDCLKF